MYGSERHVLFSSFVIISSFSLSPFVFLSSLSLYFLPFPALSFPFPSFLPLFSLFFLLYLKPSTLKIMLCSKNKQESNQFSSLPQSLKKQKTVPGNLRSIYVCVNISAKIHIHKRQSSLRDNDAHCHLETP